LQQTTTTKNTSDKTIVIEKRNERK